MKNLLRLEEALMFALAVYLNSYLPFSGWLYWLLFLTPDVGMVGYVVNPRVGAFTYNFLHHKGLAITVYLVGLYTQAEAVQLAGLVLFGHSSFDRMLGYGLKFSDSFHNTHLGKIGR